MYKRQVHAIGAGLTLCEIQQLSDITYRLYDYGRPRELHIDQSLAVSRREPHAARVEAKGEELVSCEYFTVTRHRVNGTIRFPNPPHLLIAIDGEGNIGSDDIRSGEVWYSAPGTPAFEVTGRLTLLGASSFGKSDTR